MHQQWLDNCRESERMRDELRNPKDRSDPQTYRVHFQEDRTVDLLDRVFEAGNREYGCDFKLSMKTFRKFKPFQVRKARDESCVCIHHLKWAKMIQSWYKERKKFKLPDSQCKCDLKLTPDEARRLLSCDKPLRCLSGVRGAGLGCRRGT